MPSAVRRLTGAGVKAQPVHVFFLDAGPGFVGANPVYGNPVYGNPVYGNPVYGNPVYGNPVYGNPVYGNPVYGNPVYGNPVYGNPVYGNPVYGNPAGGRRRPAGPAAVLLRRRPVRVPHHPTGGAGQLRLPQPRLRGHRLPRRRGP